MKNSSFANAIGGAMLLATLGMAMAADAPEVTYDGLKRVPDAKVAAGYVHPDADFSVYDKFLILEPHVAFRKNWQRDQNRSSVHRVTTRDMEDIKRRTVNLFMDVFTETLEEAGHPVVTEPGYDVLTVRPAIIDLDVTAPDTMSPGRSRTYVSNAGGATLFIELRDSVTGQILARAIDRKEARDYGVYQFSSRARNFQEGRRIMLKWATILRDRFDEIRK